MEQLCRISGCRIDGGGTCSPSRRTRYARERQVLERRHAAGSLRHDVIQVESPVDPRGSCSRARSPGTSISKSTFALVLTGRQYRSYLFIATSCSVEHTRCALGEWPEAVARDVTGA